MPLQLEEQEVRGAGAVGEQQELQLEEQEKQGDRSCREQRQVQEHQHVQEQE